VTERNGRWRRVVVATPFGHDLASAEALNAGIPRILQKHQIYRIDHFLGRETVQNIMALSFANGLFEPLWNRQQIDSHPDCGGRDRRRRAPGRFYETTGALRDMVPNHVFQLLAMTAMEPPMRSGPRAMLPLGTFDRVLSPRR
jgi:glucose-6-phosphate 1-dehydrogenase